MAGQGRCMGCLELFIGDGAFDFHRVGSFGRAIYNQNRKGKDPIGYTPPERRCLTPEEMQTLGMTKDEKGRWREGTATKGKRTTFLASLNIGVEGEEDEIEEGEIPV